MTTDLGPATVAAVEGQTDTNIIKFRGRAEVGSIEGDRPVLIPPGCYDFVFQGHETAFLFRTGKLLLNFKLTSLGEHHGAHLTRHYNAAITGRKRRKNGAFTVGWKSDFLREYTRLFGLPPGKKVTTEPFKNRIIRARVGTVSKSSVQKAIPVELQYSVIVELLEVIQ